MESSRPAAAGLEAKLNATPRKIRASTAAKIGLSTCQNQWLSGDRSRPSCGA